ncbi:MAG: methionyl-tRNA formyltransferase [Acidimicrobiales bacterium]
MRIAYLGTPEMAVPPLRAVHESGHEVVLVVSGADKRRGRGKETSPSPVKAAALELGLDVTADPEDLLDVDADLGVVVAYGRIIKPHLLAHLSMVNIHFSLLPRWRGAAPVERAILAGDDRTGVCLMTVEEGLDTGGVYARCEVPIGPETTAAELREVLVAAGTDLLVDRLGSGLGSPEPQSDEGVTYAHKLRSADLELHWDRPAVELHRIVRVGGAWTTFRGKRLKVHSARLVGTPSSGEPGSLDGTVAATGDGGALELEVVQPEGRGEMEAAAWVRGAQLTDDDRLGR